MDISMCNNQTCPRRLLCYRYMPGWQSHYNFEPERDKCFVPIYKGDKIRDYEVPPCVEE